MRARPRTLLILVLMMCALFLGCRKPGQTEATEHQTPQKLIVGMMSAVDSAPFYLALKRGYYAVEGVEVELILFTNGQHRQTALQTGQVDGAMTDLVALITQSASDFHLMGTLSTDGDFPLLANGTLEGKDQISVGTMEISVTNYLVDRYLAQDHALRKVFINEIPARLEAVVSGQLDVGIFPEPFASIGAQRGLQKIVFDGIPEESLNIIAFTDDAINEKRKALQVFHDAYGRAVRDIRADADLAREVMMEYIPGLPDQIRDVIYLPEYQEPRIPSEDFVAQIISFTTDVTGKKHDLSRADLLDGQFIGSR